MRVKKAVYVKEFQIKILFSDGVEKLVDFKPFLKNAKNLLIPLLDIDYFKKFAIDETTIIWPNEVDFCPDILYEAGKIVSKNRSDLVTKTTRKQKRAQFKTTASFPLSKRRTKKL